LRDGRLIRRLKVQRTLDRQGRVLRLGVFILGGSAGGVMVRRVVELHSLVCGLRELCCCKEGGFFPEDEFLFVALNVEGRPSI
jgi:hypothetical protein